MQRWRRRVPGAGGAAAGSTGAGAAGGAAAAGAGAAAGGAAGGGGAGTGAGGAGAEGTLGSLSASPNDVAAAWRTPTGLAVGGSFGLQSNPMGESTAIATDAKPGFNRSEFGSTADCLTAAYAEHVSLSVGQ